MNILRGIGGNLRVGDVGNFMELRIFIVKLNFKLRNQYEQNQF